MDVQDYYQILGVPRTATGADIKKAFRKLAREHHPDKKPGDKAAEKRFKDVNEANAVLSDPDKRAKYDHFGKDWEAYARAAKANAGKGGGAGGAGDPFGPGGAFERYAGFGAPGGGNIRYEFHTPRAGGGRGSTGGGGFSDFFEMMFGGGAARAAPKAPAEAIADITLEEAFHGATRIVDVGDRRLEVKIPRGVDTGSRVRLTGKGPQGRDLVVVIKVLPHTLITRRGADLERELSVTLREALLGADVAVSTLKGKVLLTLPAGTQGGKSFRLTGQGMPRLKGDGAGDLYVRIRVILPTHLTDEAFEAAAQFFELADQPDPRR